MIKLVVGLGNPGSKYEKTRHNVGFMVLDGLLGDAGAWSREAKFDGLVAEYTVASRKLMLLKPDVFMNRSGQSVGKVVRFYKLLADEVLVVHDELDFDVGTIKLKKGGGHAGHNGLRDIIAHLGSNEFYRLRLGIGRPPMGYAVADYVLSAPSKSELQRFESVCDQAVACIGQIAEGDIAQAMNKINA